MTKKVSPFIEQCRTRARAIMARHEEIGSPVTLSQAYELLAAADGYRTWAAMRAAGESRPASPAVPPLVENDRISRNYFSMEIFRRISLDDGTEFDVPVLLKAAHADLGYIFFDGEETPSMRFRGTRQTGPDEYATTVDIERSPLKDTAWHDDRIGKAENIVFARPDSAAAESLRGPGDAVFTGSGKKERDFPWPEDEPRAVPSAL